VLAPPVDTEFFTPAAPAAAPAAPAASPAGPPDAAGGYALVVSALAPYKRVEVAIAACSRLGLPLVVVGDGPERRRLAALAGPGVRLAGRVEGDELRRLYRGASCFLQPGVEDFGIASVEALACGTPVVALDEGGVLDVVEHGTHGVLYRGAGDAAALAAAVDNCRRMRFNPLDLRTRAEAFSNAAFREGFRALIDPLLSPGREPA
jgi:glycosyltransferase involved in cell wall biosynthesis